MWKNALNIWSFKLTFHLKCIFALVKLYPSHTLKMQPRKVDREPKPLSMVRPRSVYPPLSASLLNINEGKLLFWQYIEFMDGGNIIKCYGNIRILQM